MTICFLHCSISKQVWLEIEQHLRLHQLWVKDSAEAFFGEYFTPWNLKTFRSLPFLGNWGLQLMRSVAIFEGRLVLTFKLTTQVIALLNHYSQAPIPKQHCAAGKMEINKDNAFFFMEHAKAREDWAVLASLSIYPNDHY